MSGVDSTRPNQTRAVKDRPARRLDLLAQVREVARRHRVLLDRLSRAEEIADSLALELAQLEEDVAAGFEGSGLLRPSRLAAAAPAAAGSVLRRTAEAGVASIEIEARPDGSFDVSVDGGKAFGLPPALGDLLSILVIDSGHSEDDLVGWKTVDEVAILLAKRIGKPVRRHAATQHVYRLRRELFARGGVNPFLVQTNRRLGARFALRRPPAAMIECDRS